jgi:hypothetical protein
MTEELGAGGLPSFARPGRTVRLSAWLKPRPDTKLARRGFGRPLTSRGDFSKGKHKVPRLRFVFAVRSEARLGMTEGTSAGASGNCGPGTRSWSVGDFGNQCEWAFLA